MTRQHPTALRPGRGPRKLWLAPVNRYQRILGQQSCAQGSPVITAADRFVLRRERLGARGHPEFGEQCNRDRGQRYVDAGSAIGAPERCADERDIRVGDHHLTAGEFRPMSRWTAQTNELGRLLLCHEVIVLEPEGGPSATLRARDSRNAPARSTPHSGCVLIDVTIDQPISIDLRSRRITLETEAEVSP